MTTVSTTPAKAARGVKAATNQKTSFEVAMGSLEVLVGGPYGDHRYGHTALRVNTATTERIFDYGRYRRTWGVGNSEGEGILRVWQSFDAYISDENSLRRVTTGFLFDVPEEKAKAVLAFYDAKIGGKKPVSITKVMQSFLIDDYYALGPNCTTMSVAGAKAALPDIDKGWQHYQHGDGLSFMERSLVSAKGWPRYIFMPADLKALLEAQVGVKYRRMKSYGGQK